MLKSLYQWANRANRRWQGRGAGRRRRSILEPAVACVCVRAEATPRRRLSWLLLRSISEQVSPETEPPSTIDPVAELSPPSVKALRWGAADTTRNSCTAKADAIVFDMHHPEPCPATAGSSTPAV